MTPRQLQSLSAAAAHRRFRTEAEIGAWLTAQGISSPTERIAARLEIEAQGLATDQAHVALGTLASDLSQHRPEGPPVSREIQRLVERAGLDLTRTYTEAEVTEALTHARCDTETRMAVKATLYDLGLIRAAGAGDRRGLQAKHDMRASGERPPQYLRDASGKLLTLRSYAE